MDCDACIMLFIIHLGFLASCSSHASYNDIIELLGRQRICGVGKTKSECCLAMHSLAYLGLV